MSDSLDDFKPQVTNANKHSEYGGAVLERTIQKDGWITAITSANDGEVFDGSDRLEKAELLFPGVEPIVIESDGTRPIIVKRTDIPNAEDPRAVRLGLGANRIHEINWKPDEEVLADLYAQDESLLDGLWNEEELIDMDIIEEIHKDAPPETNRAEELLELWGVKLGDLWQIGEHRLICGDCTDADTVARLMGGERADMVTDPPYGMSLDTDWSDITGSLKSAGAKSKTKGRKYDPVIGDDKQFDASFLFEINNVKEMFLFGADYYAEFLQDKNKGSWLVWDKRKETQADAIGAEFELLWSKKKHKRRVLRHDWFGFLSSKNQKDARSRVHPTQKPVTLLEDIILQWCKEGIILDPFLGSGTTMLATENLSRRCYALEISPAYVAVSLERMATAFPELVIERVTGN